MTEKLSKNWILRGLKLRGLWRNQIITLNYIYQNDQRYKIFTSSDFGNETPTHMGPTNAITKIERKFQNRTPMEWEQNFYIPGISVIH